MNVAIAGYGVEGASSYRYFVSLGHEVTVLDQNPDAVLPAGVQAIVGDHAFDALAAYDLVVRAPGIHPDKLSRANRVTSATIEFFDKCPAPIIGVTGTKGKGTTCSFIHSILSAAGKKAWLVGNIGTPALDVLADISPKDVVVYEMSSFQLWDMQQSPHTAVVLKVEADHLDVHSGIEDYVSAKTNIALYQTSGDRIVYYSGNDVSKAIAGQSEGVKIPYPSEDYVHIRDGSFWIGDRELCPQTAVRLPGAHNIENACAAISAVQEYVQDGTVIERGLSDFKGLPHRIEFVRTVNGVEYYNDSYSSATAAAVAAIKAFAQPKVIILGGYSRGLDFRHLAEEVKAGNIKKALLIGETKHALAEALDREGFKDYEILTTTDLRQIVQAAKESAEAGDVVLLSPACASFDMFKNFSDRGNQFKAIVNGL